MADASNTLGLELQSIVRSALTGTGRQNKYTPEEIHRALNAARSTLADAIGDEAFNLFTDHRI